jgi:hypothetical protein
VSQRLNVSFELDRYGGPSMESALATLADLERAHRSLVGGAFHFFYLLNGSGKIG